MLEHADDLLTVQSLVLVVSFEACQNPVAIREAKLVQSPTSPASRFLSVQLRTCRITERSFHFIGKGFAVSTAHHDRVTAGKLAAERRVPEQPGTFQDPRLPRKCEVAAEAMIGVHEIFYVDPRPIFELRPLFFRKTPIFYTPGSALSVEKVIVTAAAHRVPALFIVRTSVVLVGAENSNVRVVDLVAAWIVHAPPDPKLHHRSIEIQPFTVVKGRIRKLAFLFKTGRQFPPVMRPYGIGSHGEEKTCDQRCKNSLDSADAAAPRGTVGRPCHNG